LLRLAPPQGRHREHAAARSSLSRNALRIAHPKPELVGVAAARRHAARQHEQTGIGRPGHRIHGDSVFADAADLLRAGNEVRQDDDVLKPELRVDAAKELANSRIRESSQHFIHDGRREDDPEGRIAQEPLD